MTGFEIEGHSFPEDDDDNDDDGRENSQVWKLLDQGMKDRRRSETASKIAAEDSFEDGPGEIEI